MGDWGDFLKFPWKRMKIFKRKKINTLVTNCQGCCLIIYVIVVMATK